MTTQNECLNGLSRSSAPKKIDADRYARMVKRAGMRMKMNRQVVPKET
jgi:hypothetical protein